MFVVHVGPQKTATTWLQHNFFNNRQRLLDAGWHYPQTGVRVRVAHHDLSDNPSQILDENGVKYRQIREIADHASENGLNVLISSEGFRSWRPRHLRKLKQAVAPHKVRIVYTLRDPVSVLYSFWMQSIKNGNVAGFPEFCRKHFARPRQSRLLNPLRELRAIARLRDVELALISYEDIKRQGRDIFDVFTEEILKLPPMPHVDRATAGNDSLPIETIEFMRLMLVTMGDWKSRSTVSMGQMFRRVISAETQERALVAVRNVPQARREKILSRNKPVFRQIEQRIVRRFSSRFVPPLSSREIFLRGRDSYPYYDQDILAADPGVAALVKELTDLYRPGGIRFRSIMFFTSLIRSYRRVKNRFRR